MGKDRKRQVLRMMILCAVMVTRCVDINIIYDNDMIIYEIRIRLNQRRSALRMMMT